MLDLRPGVPVAALEARLDQVGQVEEREVEGGRPDVKLAQLGLGVLEVASGLLHQDVPEPLVIDRVPQ